MKRTPVPILRALLPAALLLFTGCAPSAPRGTWPPPEIAEFVILQGDSVVATERISRTLDRLTGEIEMRGVARAQYIATLSGIGTMTAVHVSLRPWTGPGEEAVSVELRGDSVVVRSSAWGGLPQSFAERLGNVYVHPSPALLELILRRALLSGDSTADVRVWLLTQNTPATARLTTMPDGRVRLDMAGTPVYLTHDNGYVLRAEVPALGWVVERR
jgi:hypothetical protein